MFSTFPCERHLGKPVGQYEAKTDAGDLKMKTYLPPEAAIGTLKLSLGGPVGCFDLARLRERIGRDVRGILGMDFLRKKVVVFDFDEGRLQFLKSASVEDRDETWGRCFPIAYNSSGLVCVLVNLGKDAETPFELDSGCLGTGAG